MSRIFYFVVKVPISRLMNIFLKLMSECQDRYRLVVFDLKQCHMTGGFNPLY